MASIKDTLASFAPKTPLMSIPTTSTILPSKYTSSTTSSSTNKTASYSPITQPVQSKLPTSTTAPTISVQGLQNKPQPVPSFQQKVPSTVMTSVEAAINTPPPTRVDVKQPVSTRDTIQSKILELAGRDTIAEREQIRADAMTAEKEKTARDLSNRLQARKTAYERQIEELEKNAEGKLAGNLNAEINDLQRKANRELADISVQYNVALGDYQAAEKIVSERIADLNTQMQQETNLWKTAYDFVQNDMSESEKLQANQAWEMKMLDRKAEIDGYKTEQEIALQEAQAQNYQNLLDTGAIALKDVPKEVVGYLNVGGYVSPEQKTSLDKSKTLLTNINDFLKTGGTTAVGAPFQRAFGATAGFFGLGSYAERKAQVDNVQALLTLDNLKLMTGVRVEAAVLKS